MERAGHKITYGNRGLSEGLLRTAIMSDSLRFLEIINAMIRQLFFGEGALSNCPCVPKEECGFTGAAKDMLV
jgi:hypothetical protein